MIQRMMIIPFLAMGLFSWTSCNSALEEAEITSKTLTVSDITHKHVNDFGNKVYIMENEEYVPYYVIDDYNDGILLLREELLPDMFAYADSSINGTGAGYYPGSVIDDYLSDTFITFFSDEVQNLILETDIEIASEDTVLRDVYKRESETIKRKVFLLSATEYGIQTLMATNEGHPIKCLGDYLTPDTQWLRSAYLVDDVHAWTISSESYGGENVVAEQYIRPALILPCDAVVEAVPNIIEGQYIIVLSCEANQ